jgi:hypothetical protein
MVKNVDPEAGGRADYVSGRTLNFGMRRHEFVSQLRIKFSHVDFLPSLCLTFRNGSEYKDGAI